MTEISHSRVDTRKQVTAPSLPLAPLPACDHELQKVAYSVGHTGCLFRCAKCGGYTMRGEPNGVRN